MWSLTDKLISSTAWALVRESESLAQFFLLNSSSNAMSPQPCPLARACNGDSRKYLSKNYRYNMDDLVNVRPPARRLMDSSRDKVSPPDGEKVDVSASKQSLVSSTCWTQGFIQARGSPLQWPSHLLYEQITESKEGRHQSASPDRNLLKIIFIKLLFNVIFPYLQNFIRPYFKN